MSEESSAALRQGTALARSFDVPLYLLPTGTASPNIVDRALRTANAEDLDVHFLPAPDEQLDEHVRQCVLANDVSIVLTDTPTDRGPVPPLASASSTKALVNTLDCSIFVVEHNADPSSIRRILVPTDLSDDTPAVLDGVTALATAYDASVDVLHVIEAVPYVALTPVDRLSLSSTSFPEHRARHRLSTLLDKSVLDDNSVERHFEYGDPADQIARFVNRHAVDLLVLGANESSKNGPLGPVCDRVLRRVACPVVLVRPSDAPPGPGESMTSSLSGTTE